MKKGPRFEKTALDTYIRRIWPDAKRYGSSQGGTSDKGDYVRELIEGWTIDAKHRKSQAVTDHIRKIARKALVPGKWSLILRWDKRQVPVDVVVMDAEMWVLLMRDAGWGEGDTT